MQPFRESGDEVFRSWGDILGAIAQWSQRNWEYAEAVEQIFSESAVVHACPKILIRRRNDTDVDGNGSGTADALHLGFLKDPQELWLGLSREIAISSRNSVPPSASSNYPSFRVTAPVKAPLS